MVECGNGFVAAPGASHFKVSKHGDEYFSAVMCDVCFSSSVDIINLDNFVLF